MGAKHAKYLGLPSFVGQSKKELVEGIKDRVRRKMNSWATKKLSQAGRAVLIKLIVQVIPTYVMACFWIPDSFLPELESMTTSFFWHGELEHRMHWGPGARFGSIERRRSWIRRLKENNSMLLAKQERRATTPPGEGLAGVRASLEDWRRADDDYCGLLMTPALTYFPSPSTA
ncbi:UNVERIFIED_CONTAM: hypothetical protein Sindi_2849200 [Sesamum indicum]